MCPNCSVLASRKKSICCTTPHITSVTDGLLDSHFDLDGSGHMESFCVALRCLLRVYFIANSIVLTLVFLEGKYCFPKMQNSVSEVP